ncbi:hypothetical protein DRQ25_13010 [Candidatus Fermentibacteria bacterium]|nr:MAG: hypothetical protein DRQ25_13010 [Candidatus Fermentibacteria bacterium]
MDDKITIKQNTIQEGDKLDDFDKEILNLLSRANRLGAAELQNILCVDTIHRITGRCKKLEELKLLDKHTPRDKRVYAEYSLHRTFLCLGDLVCIPLHLSNSGGFDMVFHITGSCPFRNECNYPEEPCKLYPFLAEWSNMADTTPDDGKQ